MNRQVAAREAGDCASPHICCHWRAAAAMVFSHFLLPRGGAARAVVHGEAVNNGKRRRKPPLSPHCAKRNAARVPRPADFAEVCRMGGSVLVRKTRRLARWERGRGLGKPRCDIEALLRKGLTEYISKLCRSAHLLLLAGCCRDGVLTLSATPWGRGTRRCSRRSREQREAAAKAAAFAALREAQCGARAAPRRFRRGAPNGGICTCAENAAFGEVGEGARAGKAAANTRQTALI